MPSKKLILTESQKQSIRDLAKKYTKIPDIVRESGFTRHYVYEFLREEELVPQAKRRTPYVPKDKTSKVVLFKEEEKKPFVRPAAVYSNRRSLYNLD